MRVLQDPTLLAIAFLVSMLSIANPAPAPAQVQPSLAVPDETTHAQAEQPVAAGNWELLRGRLSLHLNSAFQTRSQQFDKVMAFSAYGEDASLVTRYGIDGSLVLDLGGQIRVWRQLAVGAAYTQLASTAETVVTGSVPHPIDFNRPRSLVPKQFPLVHNERATHIHVTWVIPVREQLDVAVFGGPSLFNLRQGAVTNVTAIKESGPPFASVTVDIGTGEYARNGVGGHVGMDVNYMLTSHIGVGSLIRFATAFVDLPQVGPDFILSVGGIHVAGGVRVRF